MKKLLFLTYTLLLSLSIPQNVYAMHISEGYLPLNWSAFYGLLVLPFLFFGVRKLNKLSKKNKEIKMLLGLIAAFVFMMSALKIPSVTGSCSHPTGTGIGAIIFGPIIMSVISLVVLLFQALLLVHGGITTLGANLFSMGIVGPFVAFGIYKILKNKNELLAVGLAAALGDLTTYIITSIQLGLAFPSTTGGVALAIGKFMGIFAITQIPLAIVEGIISVIIYDFIKKHCEKEILGIMEE
ncbi:energy-coupling factor ABC transporter permease [uncultured Clostridium sp.]|uniref:energy-coupling factor ABC transporter permease n=1 Tax=uncultured Clostridium sp. TaxID=59620 RepID=UPI0028E4D967|nr:energy-coupling factor ABC transporter permease [uncultured Clostridium sp.]